MNIKWIVACLAAGLLAGCASESALQAKAKISRADAEKVAMKEVPNGTVKEAELEQEHGKLLWSFDMTTPGSKDITEVEVDAITGVLFKTEKEQDEDKAKK